MQYNTIKISSQNIWVVTFFEFSALKLSILQAIVVFRGSIAQITRNKTVSDFEKRLYQINPVFPIRISSICPLLDFIFLIRSYVLLLSVRCKYEEMPAKN